MPANKSDAPGIGMSGIVVCPLFKGPCMKGGCEWWVELNYPTGKVARCSMAWLSILSTEVRGSIDRLKTKEKADEPRNQEGPEREN